MILNLQIAEEARKWAKEKVPYVHRGTTNRGCDCTGLIIGVMRQIGRLTDYQLPYYSRDWNLSKNCSENILNELDRFAFQVDITEAMPGDILIFRFARANSHAGIHIGGKYFVHSYEKAGRCTIGVLQNSLWQKRLTRIYRFDETKV